MANVRKNSLLLLVAATFIFSGCNVGSFNDVDKKPSVYGNIQDNLEWYDAIPDRDTPVEMRVSVPVPNDYLCKPWNNWSAPEHPCTLDDIINDKSAYDEYKPEVHIVFDADDFPNNTVNASMEQKGKSTRASSQPSFRIKLDSKIDLYHDERVIQLNKSPFDYSRIKNKLWFDTFIGIPNFTSLRTRFVHLSIDGKSYGIYHQMEHVDEEFLKNRGWNTEDNTYKAQNFTFNLSPDLALNDNGKPLYPEKFDAIIEQKTGKDTKKLISMLQELDEVYMDSNKFKGFFNKYFNKENYLTWIAINIIVSNKDTISQNFYLYNPKYSDKFYFLPWDYDGAGYKADNLAKYQKGFGFLWEAPLHRGFLSIKENRDALNQKILELRQSYFTDAVLQVKVNKYASIVAPFIQSAPDNQHLSYQRWRRAVDTIVPQININIQNYFNELGSPMPFWQSATYTNGELKLSWSRSVDLEGDPLVYDLKVSKHIDMSYPLLEVTGIADEPLQEDPTSIIYNANISLSPGRYYMKVVAKERNNPNSYQIAFDTSTDPNNPEKDYYGVLAFDVP